MTDPTPDQQSWPFRPHHLMCWQTYRGNGYSPAFVASFDSLQAAAKLRPDQPIRLAIAADPICAPCPQRVADSCTWSASVDARDRALLAQTGFTEGQTMALDEGLDLVGPRFLALQAHVCVDCDWRPACEGIYREDHPGSDGP
jgi:hypothetical protein